MTFEIPNKQIDCDLAAAGLTARCPGCVSVRGRLTLADILWLEEKKAVNPMSIHTPGLYLCRVCSKAENLAHAIGLDFPAARITVNNDWQEAMRLPPGLLWGVSRWPTGGLMTWLNEGKRRDRVLAEYRRKERNG